MPCKETDPALASLREELEVVIEALNRLYHPVYPGSPSRIRELEQRLAEIRARIRERRRTLAEAGGEGD